MPPTLQHKIVGGYSTNQKVSSEVYSFVSYPSTILSPNRAKFRNEEAINIMFDPRVVRGNTYALKVPLRPLGSNQMDTKNLSQPGTTKFQKLPDLDGPYNPALRLNMPDQIKMTTEDRVMSERKYLAARSRARKRMSRFSGNSNGKDPESGRKHCQIQTDDWLEKVQDKQLEVDVAVQTDQDSWPIISTSRKTAHPICDDKSTQIKPNDPDLFIFDEEVGSILTPLIGKTLEQGVLEVINEEECAEISKQKIAYQDKALMLKNT